MTEEFERKPLDIADFAPNLQRHLTPDAPAPLKAMAARGMVPAPPEQLLKILFQLHFDQALANDVQSTLTGMPEAVLLAAVQAEQPAVILDWIAETSSDQILNAVVLHKNTHDATIISLAKNASADLCDLIANNQVRVLRTPEIIEKLYKNVNARMATVDKLVALARQNDVNIPNIAAIGLLDETDEDITESLLDDNEFAGILQQETVKIKGEEARHASLEKLTRAERERLDAEHDVIEEEKAQRTSGTLQSQIAQMSISQKVRLATIGSKEAINILVRDSNKLIHMAAIRSPRIQPADVRKYAANKSLPEGVIRHIALNRDWTRHYDVIVHLVSNPKTPLSDVLGFLNHLRAKELRDLARSRTVPQQVSRMARTLSTKRSG